MTVQLSLELVAVIDERIKQVLKQLTANGTVVSVTDQTNAMVTFDGSLSAVPVKVAGDVSCYEGDRVALLAVGTRPWWTTVAVMARHWPAYSATMVIQSSGTTTSATLTDLPTTSEVTVIKRWAETKLSVHIDTSGSFSTAINTSGVFGVRITSATGAVSTLDVAEAPYNGTDRESTSGTLTVTGLAAGTYTVRALWRRGVGAGTLTVDGFSRVGVTVAEVSP